MSGQDAGQGTKEESIGLDQELDSAAREVETVVSGGTGGGSKKGGVSTTTVSEEEKAKQEGIAVNPLDPKDRKTCKD